MASAFLPWLFVGITKSTFAVELFVSQSAISGMPVLTPSCKACASVIGSVKTNTKGSMKYSDPGFVKVPGINLPAIAFAPVTSANILTGWWPYSLADTTTIEEGS